MWRKILVPVSFVSCLSVVGWTDYEFKQLEKREKQLITHVAGSGLSFTFPVNMISLLLSKSKTLQNMCKWDPAEAQKLYNLDEELSIMADDIWEKNIKKLYKSQKARVLPTEKEKFHNLMLEEEVLESEMYNSDCHFTHLGKFLMKNRYHDRLVKRKEIIQYAKDNEQILNSPSIDSRLNGNGMIAIVGQHRTGSTLLQNLLHLDPKNRSTILWHQLALPPPLSANSK